MSLDNWVHPCNPHSCYQPTQNTPITPERSLTFLPAKGPAPPSYPQSPFLFLLP